MLGCNVFTRPSMISGKPVTVATSVTATPAARKVLAVPPVDKISKPSASRARANGASPSLFATLSKARRFARGLLSSEATGASGEAFEAEAEDRCVRDGRGLRLGLIDPGACNL